MTHTENTDPQFYTVPYVSLRYYAALQSDQSGRVGSFTDIGHVISVPDRETVIPLTEADYTKYKDTAWLYYEDKKFIQKRPPAPSLKEQAETALPSAQSFLYSHYGILNQPTPDAWVAYLRALQAIINGTDTTSTDLPPTPEDVT